MQTKFSQKWLRFLRLFALLLASILLLAATTTGNTVAREPQVHTSNPYTGQAGPPDCTWYAWQRLHDTEHIDLQFSANAIDWITYAQQPNAAWSEASQSFIQPQINTTPAVGDIVVLPYPSAYARPYHVAYVESVNSNGTFLVSQQSYGDVSPGINTKPYPYVDYATWSLAAMQNAEQGHDRFLHFVQQQSTNPPPAPNVDKSQLISSSPNLLVGAGQQFNINFVFENVGTTTWSDSGQYALACDTFYHSASNCMNGHFAGFNGQQVAPNQSFSFTVTLTAPSTAGTYTTWWDMRHNGSIFGSNNASVQVIVQAPSQPTKTVTPTVTTTSPPTPRPVDNSLWISNSSTVTIQPGQSFTIQFTYQNDGNTTWSTASGYALSCDTFYHSGSNCMGGNPVSFGNQSVSPGQQFMFTLSLTAPTTPGTYTTWWDMTHNGSIFGNNNSYVTVTVSAPPPPPTTPPGWQPLLQQSAPDCNNPGGTTWQALPDTTLSCTGSGLLMQQTTANYYAEDDLDQVNGTTYNQTNFRVQVNATFENTGDTSTWAALLVQTPQATTATGGFILVLNPAGQWQLQQVITGTDIPAVQSGSVSINPGQPTTMMVVVQNGILYGYINGQEVVSYVDSLNPSPGAVSLMVERPHATPSSIILYSNFELDMWG